MAPTGTVAGNPFKDKRGKLMCRIIPNDNLTAHVVSDYRSSFPPGSQVNYFHTRKGDKVQFAGIDGPATNPHSRRIGPESRLVTCLMPEASFKQTPARISPPNYIIYFDDPHFIGGRTIDYLEVELGYQFELSSFSDFPRGSQLISEVASKLIPGSADKAIFPLIFFPTLEIDYEGGLELPPQIEARMNIPGADFVRGGIYLVHQARQKNIPCAINLSLSSNQGIAALPIVRDLGATILSYFPVPDALGDILAANFWNVPLRQY